MNTIESTFAMGGNTVTVKVKGTASESLLEYDTRAIAYGSSIGTFVDNLEDNLYIEEAEIIEKK